ncbi:hypothetical protein WOLCODRAFT_161389 [Wolfiporia cocos MD-104 SS10]|uniref:Uncharacterized protein n=1 Tax=Wolfiporia cocos (strain MD-104) TaxID=742152 RepID=A0A2H3J7L8_WOLCO|nr:hypothetical protein WOLCODRAFT_161389 [Wolfiporia cocos MD-104 SS10]
MLQARHAFHHGRIRYRRQRIGGEVSRDTTYSPDPGVRLIVYRAPRLPEAAASIWRVGGGRKRPVESAGGITKQLQDRSPEILQSDDLRITDAIHDRTDSLLSALHAG